MQYLLKANDHQPIYQPTFANDIDSHHIKIFALYLHIISCITINFLHADKWDIP
jgi:hypothetical protein